MRKDKDAAVPSLEADQDFSRFLKMVRKEEKILLEQLARGLMTASQLARIEKGQRSVCKDMRDRLLGRLGISSDLYENLLNIEDAAAWEWQRSVLCAVEQKEFQKVGDLLSAYEDGDSGAVGDKTKQQFCLVMRAEILKQQGADQREIGDCYGKAVKLTVPDVDLLCVAELLLSIQEINMVLEYAFYHRSVDFAEKCRELIAYVENSAYDDLSKGKIYPKIVYYYLREILSGQDRQTPGILREGLRLCDQAVGLLRDTGRAFYLLEILELRITVLERIGRSSGEGVEERKTESMELAGVLRALSGQYGVPAYMQDCTYLYRQRWMFYVGDVLRIRREMYGLTQKELCGGECSARTLRRAEKKEANMQQAALGNLLRKLGLSREFQRARLVSSDREVLRLREEIAACRNNHEPGKARELLARMKRRVSVGIPENRQYFMEIEASLDWMEGKITGQEFAEREDKAIQCTLGIKGLYQMGEVYLTQMEMACIRRRIEVLDDAGKRECIGFLLRVFDSYEKKNALSDYISMYEFAASCAVCELGSMEEYKRSTDLAEKVLRQDLQCKRLWGIEAYLYEISWNERQQHITDGQTVENEKMTESLRQCMILSHFCKRTFYEDFYRRKYVTYGHRSDMAGHCTEQCPLPPNKNHCQLQYYRW